MGREGESGEETEGGLGWVPGVWSLESADSRWGWRPVPLKARWESDDVDSTGEFLASSIMGKPKNAFRWRVLLPVVGWS